jgi:glycosyltransferase involved in cell wall biosynthesis
MRILVTVDPEIPVPPIHYGGIERIVDALIRSYASLGHEVFLVANPESTNLVAKKILHWPSLYSRGWNNIANNSFFLLRQVKQLKPDVIHSFSRLLYLYPIFAQTKVPVVQSYQRAISQKSTKMAKWVAGHKLSFTCCGAHMIKGHYLENKCIPIHNFADVNYFLPDDNIEKEHLMFLGRIEEIKGTKEAIEVALKANEKLIIAGNIQPGHEAYFESQIRPFLDNPLIEYVGSVDDEQKRFYLQRSKAFLFPIKWEEPFGIVMAEAMACGVPVIGFNRGSVPEVVDDGKSGFVVENTRQMTIAISKISDIDRKKVRQEAENRFSIQSISKQYLDFFERAVKNTANTKL